MWRARFFASAGALACGAAAAQVLPQVTVTATRTEAAPFDVPASVDVIDGERLRASGRAEVQLSEALAFVPGVTARDRQNFAQDLQLSIRGFGARSTFGVRGVRLYVDGVPATMPDGQGQLSHFDLSSASRVEVLRGPFSALYGNSSGGVVQMFTEAGEGRGAVTGSVVAGSDGLLKPALRVTGATGAVGVSASASRFSTDGWRDHSAAERSVGNLRLDWKPQGGGEWMFVANILDLRADDPLGLSRAQFDANPRGVDANALTFNTRKTVHQSQVGLVHERRIAGDDKLRVMVYTGERGTDQYQAIPAAAQANPLHPGGMIDLTRRYGGVDVRWTAKRGPLEAVAGLSYDALEEDRRGWQNFVGSTLGVQGALRRDERNDVTNLDPYVQAVWKPSDAWTLTAGVRHSSVRFRSSDRYIVGTNGDDSGSVSYSAALPVLAAMWNFSPRLHAYASAGKGFETPTFNELAYRPDGRAGLNFALKPARSRNIEAGLKGRSARDATLRYEWSAAVFDVGTRDEIVTQSNVGGRSTFRNAGETSRRGAELGAALEFARDWRAQVAQTWISAKYDDTGNRIPGIARSFTGVDLAYEPAQGWRAGAELRRSAKVFVNDANSDAAGSWTTFGLHAGWRKPMGDWTLDTTLRVDNVTDRRYAGSVIVNEGNSRFFEPAPGRQYSLKLALRRAL
ncbi:TonB-dependent receptor family protein [Ramlibacter albus]|uniref:TonB-dependent receptor n=1 Tax=Ramlibacter albus TaxID=2079448 RepID=A0A923M9X8_9BURK|nr:TonB-dependent receptor [Ramlibacter albus]MBC5766725.1 TonB-dependent receptor [Ramlibacter albus]